MGVRISENLYEEYGVPTLDLVFTQPNNGLLNVVDNGQIAVEFTRTQDTQASYVKSDGIIGYAATDVPRFDHDLTTGESLGLLIEEQRTNLLTNSEELDNSVWANVTFGSTVTVDSNVITSPNGTITADKLNFPGRRSQNYGNVSGTHTISAYVKKGDMSSITLYLDVINVPYPRVNYNFDTDTVSGTNATEATRTLLSNGWVRISCTATLGGSTKHASFASGTTGYTYVWGVQLEQGSFPTSYIPTPAIFTSRASVATFYNENGIVSTASTDVARDDAYLPDENGNFISAGLLLEEERDNILLHSKDFSSTWDGSTNGTLTLNATTSPDGTNNAALFQNDGLDNSFLGKGLFQTFTGIGATTPMVGSVYVKNNDASLFTFGLGSLNNRSASLQFDFSTETVTSLSDGGRGSTMSSKVDKLPNDWYRLSFSLTTVDIGVSRIVLNADTGNDTTSVYVWGAQLEVNNDEVGNLNFVEQSTSYIPTTSGISTRAADISSSSTSTRGADTASITGAGFSSFYNSSEGTLLTNITPHDVTNNYFAYSLSDGTSNERIVSLIGNSYSHYIVDGGSIQAQIDYAGYTANAETKAAAAYATNDISYATDGTVRGTDTSATIPTVDNLVIMANRSNGNQTTGHISRLTYWPRRLPDSDLQRLTE